MPGATKRNVHFKLLRKVLFCRLGVRRLIVFPQCVLVPSQDLSSEPGSMGYARRVYRRLSSTSTRPWQLRVDTEGWIMSLPGCQARGGRPPNARTLRSQTCWRALQPTPDQLRPHPHSFPSQHCTLSIPSRLRSQIPTDLSHPATRSGPPAAPTPRSSNATATNATTHLQGAASAATTCP